MKSKLALMLCLTQLCIFSKQYPLEAAYKVSKANATILNKKVVATLGLATLGSAIALYAKHNHHVESYSSTTQQLCKVTSQDRRSEVKLAVNDTISAFMKSVDHVEHTVDLNPSDVIPKLMEESTNFHKYCIDYSKY